MHKARDLIVLLFPTAPRHFQAFGLNLEAAVSAHGKARPHIVASLKACGGLLSDPGVRIHKPIDMKTLIEK